VADDGHLVLFAVREPLLRDVDGKDTAFEDDGHF